MIDTGSSDESRKPYMPNTSYYYSKAEFRFNSSTRFTSLIQMDFENL